MLDFGKPEYEVRCQYGNDYKHMTAESKKKWYAKVVGDSIEIRTSSMRVNTLVVVESDGTIRLSANGTMILTKQQILELATVVQEAINMLGSSYIMSALIS